MSQPAQESEQLGIVGTGLMGRGIAQIAAQAGIPVVLYDKRPSAAEEARKAIAETWAMLIAKGKLTPEAAAESTARLRVANELAGLKTCSIVVEAIAEKLDVKQCLLQEVEAIVSDQCIIATNTSSLSVAALAAGCKHPERVAGFHFFSPVPLMKVVEVISAPLTDAHVANALVDMAKRMGHTPVRASDTPGFIVNHAGRGYVTEALRLLGENIAPHSEIDRILHLGAGFRMGPFELLDLTGLDVSQPVMESIYEQFFQEPRFRPSPIARQRQAAGLLGRKTQRGFYSYENGKKRDVPPLLVPERKDIPVWIDPVAANDFPAVVKLIEGLGAKLDKSKKPASSSLCMVLPIGRDVTTCVTSTGLDPTRTVALDPLFQAGCRTLMLNPLTSPKYRDAAHALFAADGVPVAVIHDSPGFVSQRVIASIVNIGCDIAQQAIATPEDIDLSVNLGLGYPLGPLSMGDRLGARTVLRILDEMYDFYRDPRYRASPWLKRRALLGQSLLTPEN